MSRRCAILTRACVVALLGCLSETASASPAVILGFKDGVIVWTNAYTQGVVTLQWATTPQGPWWHTWEGYYQQPVVAPVMAASVPLFFRVANDPLQISWVTVGQPHNAADSTGYGAVNYTFRMGRYEVSNLQYAQFLNTVDPSGSNARKLYNSKMATDPRGGITNDSTKTDGSHYVVETNMFDKPVNYVSFWDAARFANWLHNGQGTNTTETGAYDLVSADPPNTTVSRMPRARVFLPSEDEWYKAAYYHGTSMVYRLYPTKSDQSPVIALCGARGGITNDSESIANYASGAKWNNQTGNVTTVGSGGSGSESWYGAADMAGNVYEWTEALVATNARCIRGGAWHSVEVFLRSTSRDGYSPTTEVSSLGFRLAAP